MHYRKLNDKSNVALKILRLESHLEIERAQVKADERVPFEFQSKRQNFLWVLLSFFSWLNFKPNLLIPSSYLVWGEVLFEIQLIEANCLNPR